jgi:hypothetical protein
VQDVSVTRKYATELRLAVLAVACAASFGFLFQLQQTPLFEHLAGKSYTMFLWADRLARGTAGPGQAFYGPPLPLWYLSGIVSLFGPGMGVVRLLGGIACVCACALTWDVGRRWGGEAVGLLSALGLALYGPLYYYEATLPGTALTICLMLGGLAAALRADQRHRMGFWAASGALFGAAALARPNLHLLALGLGLWALIGGAGGWRRRIAALALVVVGWAAAQGLHTVIDLHLYGRSDNAPTWGISLYVGNGPGASVGYGTVPFVRASNQDDDVSSFVAEAARRTGRPLDVAAAGRFWAGETLRYMLRRPAAAAGLILRKAAMCLAPAEIPDNWDYQFWTDRLPVLRWMLRFGHIMALCVVGLALGVMFRRRATALLGLLLVAYCASMVVTFVLGRYRVLAVPVLLVWAAAGLLNLSDGVRRLRPRAIAALVAVALLTGGLLLLPPPYDARATESNAWVDLGVLYEQDGRPDQAARAYAEALQVNDRQLIAHIYLGDILAASGDVAGAIGHYEAAGAVGPLSPAEMVRLGRMWLEHGDSAAASAWLLRALAAQPGAAPAYKGLAACWRRDGWRLGWGAARSEGGLASSGGGG